MPNSDEAIYHHGEIDPLDYQVDDILLCVAAYPGLQVDNLYMTHAVARHRTPEGVAITATVITGGELVEVCPVERFLVRTRLVTHLWARDGSIATHSFPDYEDFERWCAVSRVRVAYGVQFVKADRPLAADARFAALGVPGKRADDTDTMWYVCDLSTRTVEKVGVGPAARDHAIRVSRSANDEWRAEREARQ